jgi:hypothetical protein
MAHIADTFLGTSCHGPELVIRSFSETVPDKCGFLHSGFNGLKLSPTRHQLRSLCNRTTRQAIDLSRIILRERAACHLSRCSLLSPAWPSVHTVLLCSSGPFNCSFALWEAHDQQATFTSRFQ